MSDKIEPQNVVLALVTMLRRIPEEPVSLEWMDRTYLTIRDELYEKQTGVPGTSASRLEALLEAPEGKANLETPEAPSSPPLTLPSDELAIPPEPEAMVHAEREASDRLEGDQSSPEEPAAEESAPPQEAAFPDQATPGGLAPTKAPEPGSPPAESPGEPGTSQDDSVQPWERPTRGMRAALYRTPLRKDEDGSLIRSDDALEEGNEAAQKFDGWDAWFDDLGPAPIQVSVKPPDKRLPIPGTAGDFARKEEPGEALEAGVSPVPTAAQAEEANDGARPSDAQPPDRRQPDSPPSAAQEQGSPDRASPPAMGQAPRAHDDNLAALSQSLHVFDPNKCTRTADAPLPDIRALESVPSDNRGLPWGAHVTSSVVEISLEDFGEGPAPMLDLPEIHARRYKPRTQIGAGGQGVVTEVTDRHLARQVALKALRRELSNNHRASQLFWREAQITGQLSHSGILPIYDVGLLPDGSPYYTMRRVQGPTLRTILRKLRRALQGHSIDADALSRGTGVDGQGGSAWNKHALASPALDEASPPPPQPVAAVQDFDASPADDPADSDQPLEGPPGPLPKGLEPPLEQAPPPRSDSKAPHEPPLPHAGSDRPLEVVLAPLFDALEPLPASPLEPVVAPPALVQEQQEPAISLPASAQEPLQEPAVSAPASAQEPLQEPAHVSLPASAQQPLPRRESQPSSATPDRVPYETLFEQLETPALNLLATLDPADLPEVVRKFSRRRLIEILTSAAHTVGYAHHRGVVHRDLKPGNLMIGNYGEVFVLDWGIARVLGAAPEFVSEGPVLLQEMDPELSGQGMIKGTPGYMSPEQAWGDADTQGTWTDVYAFGLILYEILTNTPARSVSGSDEAIRLAREGTIEAPEARRLRENLPVDPIPPELERICMKCLEKNPSLRFPDAEAFAGALEAYLTGEQQRENAEARAREAEAKVAELEDLDTEISTLAAEAAKLGEGIEPWMDISRKRKMWVKEERLKTARLTRDDTLAAAFQLFTQALGDDPENRRARSGLCRLYFSQLLEAEYWGRAREARRLELELRRLDDGSMRLALVGNGSLELTSEPEGAQVWCADLRTRDHQLQPAEGRFLGTTPLITHLRMGRYMFEARWDDHKVSYPVRVRRQEKWTGRVKLYKSIPEGFVLVPGGPFTFGGDREAPGAGPRKEICVDDFMIARFPVTCAQYLEFLQALEKRSSAEAARRVPRLSGRGGSEPLWPSSPRTGYRIPGVDSFGGRWAPDLAVHCVSREDAVAYCLWRAAQDGLPLRLPTEFEWEKAGRGVDGRWFPWGDDFDASFCNMKDAQPGGPELAPIGSFSADCSPYGARDMAGGVIEWCAGEFAQDGILGIQKGGFWLASQANCRLARRFGVFPTEPEQFGGFRMAFTP